MFCRELVVQLRDHQEELRAGGAHLAVIGCGSVAQASAFRTGFKLPFPVYVDPDLRSFEAAGLRRELGVKNPFVTATHAFRALLRGARPAAVEGDPWQQGGTFAFAAGGELLFAHRSNSVGDHAPLDELITALT